jgi:alkylation response protein AidB-like acyl-CoA dehydrogenase
MIRDLGPMFAARAAAHDADDSFVADNYADLKRRKIFCSGASMGNVLMTSAVYDDPQAGSTVRHFAVPFTADGVTIMDNWRTLGMRATGSHDVLLDAVFVPESGIALRRPRGKWHLFWTVAITVAMPLIMAVYVGIAEAAAALARREAVQKRQEPHVPYLVGEMENALVTAQMALQGMIDTAADYDFPPVEHTANAILIRKTITAHAAVLTVEKALEVVGGAGFFRSFGLERLLRDVHGAAFHPLPEKRQWLFTGRSALGLDPIG